MAGQRAPLIALLTDFGTEDWYVASLKAVMLDRCPNARFLDITHQVPAQQIAAGAFILNAIEPYLPKNTLVLAIVDPGVGTTRPLLAAKTDRLTLVGPDNGLLSMLLERARKPTLVRLAPRAHWLPNISQTFHGRDILAPTAAALANGAPLRSLGSPCRRFIRLPAISLRQRGATWTGRIVYIDTFGNLITNLPNTLIRSHPNLQIRYRLRRVRVVSSYRNANAKDVVALPGSIGFIELAVRNASAAQAMSARVGDPVRAQARS